MHLSCNASPDSPQGIIIAVGTAFHTDRDCEPRCPYISKVVKVDSGMGQAYGVDREWLHAEAQVDGRPMGETSKVSSRPLPVASDVTRRVTGLGHFGTWAENAIHESNGQ